MRAAPSLALPLLLSGCLLADEGLYAVVPDLVDEVEQVEEEALGWDPTPPDVPLGTHLVIELVCGLLDGPQEKVWEKTQDTWREIRPDDWEQQPVAYPDLEVCFGRGTEKYLDWYPGGDIFIRAGGLDHELVPTQLEDRWFGGVLPEGTLDEEACDEALEARGMAWPVPLSMQLLEIKEP